MKKDVLYIPFILVGIATGFSIAIIDGLTKWDLFFEIFFGALVGLIIGIAFLQKQYGILVGAVIGLLVESSLDLLAGSPVVMKDKLVPIYLYSFIGWSFPVYLKQMFIGGVIGGLVGFGWGLISNHQFGDVYLAPSVFTAFLMFIVMRIVGMVFGKLYMMIFGYRYLKTDQ